MSYYAFCTSVWVPNDFPDESFCSDDFGKALAFCIERQDRNKSACVLKVEGQKEEIIVSFRTIK